MSVLDGARVKRAREGRGLKQSQLAALAKLDVSTVSRIERGLITPTVATLKALAAALGVSLESLLSDEEPRRKSAARASRKAA